MIRTADGQVNLKALEELLQKRLNSESSANPPLQIHCVLREETPIVLIRLPGVHYPLSQANFFAAKTSSARGTNLGKFPHLDVSDLARPRTI